MSRYITTDALVLSSRPFGEADRLVVFLTWQIGKLTALAKGARKIKSKLASGVDLFTYGCYHFFQGRSLATVTGQEVRERFLPLRQEPTLYSHGLYMAALIDRLIHDQAPGRAACELLLAGWKLLGEEEADLLLLVRAFELKLLEISGYRPNIDHCLLCNSPAPVVLSASQGALLCAGCAGHGGQRLHQGTLALAGRILTAPLEQVRRLRPLPGQNNELALLTETFLRYSN